YPLLDAFDLPDMANSCPRRDTTVTAPQALALLNGSFTELQAHHWARRLVARYGQDQHALVEAAYREAYGRLPTDKEFRAAHQFMSTEATNARKAAAKESKSNESAAKSAGTTETLPPDVEAVVDFCHALFNTNEFLYVD